LITTDKHACYPPAIHVQRVAALRDMLTVA